LKGESRESFWVKRNVWFWLSVEYLPALSLSPQRFLRHLLDFGVSGFLQTGWGWEVESTIGGDHGTTEKVDFLFTPEP